MKIVSLFKKLPACLQSGNFFSTYPRLISKTFRAHFIGVFKAIVKAKLQADNSLSTW